MVPHKKRAGGLGYVTAGGRLVPEPLPQTRSETENATGYDRGKLRGALTGSHRLDRNRLPQQECARKE